MEEIQPQPDFNPLSPRPGDFAAASQVIIDRSGTAWPEVVGAAHLRVRRFGFAGTNVHVVVGRQPGVGFRPAERAGAALPRTSWTAVSKDRDGLQSLDTPGARRAHLESETLRSRWAMSGTERCETVVSRRDFAHPGLPAVASRVRPRAPGRRVAKAIAFRDAEILGLVANQAFDREPGGPRDSLLFAGQGILSTFEWKARGLDEDGRPIFRRHARSRGGGGGSAAPRDLAGRARRAAPSAVLKRRRIGTAGLLFAPTTRSRALLRSSTGG